MTNTEIKKLYTKTKKAFEKRTGEKHTWVMNARQQRLGTATILVDASYDFVEKLASTKDYYSDDKVKARTEQSWKFYVKEAEEEAATGGASWNPTYWRDILASKGSLDDMMAEAQAHADKAVAEAQADLDKYGSFSDQVKKAHEYAKSFISSPEVQSFLQATGGTTAIEDKQERGAVYTYVRFYYTATAV